MQFFFDIHHTVSDDEIDAQEHVHNLRYLQWTLWAARDHSAACGWDAKAGLERGVGWVVRGHEATYRAAALAGDEIVVRTWISELSSYASLRRYIVCRLADRKILARVATRWVFVDLNRRKALAIPEEIRTRIPVSPRTPPPPWEDAR